MAAVAAAAPLAPLIFLDVDGVLVPARCLRGSFDEADESLLHDAARQAPPLGRANLAALARLARAAPGGAARIILSSSWRLPIAADLRAALERALGGAGIALAGATGAGGGGRGAEVAGWVLAHAPGAPLVVLDDDHAKSFELAGLKPFLVAVDAERGLTEADADAALRILEGQASGACAVWRPASVLAARALEGRGGTAA